MPFIGLDADHADSGHPSHCTRHPDRTGGEVKVAGRRSQGSWKETMWELNVFLES